VLLYIFICIESSREILVAHVSSSSVVASLLDLVKILMPAVEASCKRHSPVGCHQRAQMALRELHTLEKRFENTDQLMVRKSFEIFMLIFVYISNF
jgi:E3 ubiquitin-protein ligase UBR4